MNNALPLLLPFATGVVLGLLFFGGLWWTVRKGMTSRVPALWFLGSMMLRVALVVMGFAFVGRDNWHFLVACLIGFIIARIAILRFASVPPTLLRDAREEPHASDA